MNTINFQRNSNYNITRKTTSYSDSSGGTRYNVAYARHLDIPEKDILESKRFVAPESTCKPDHYDKKFYVIKMKSKRLCMLIGYLMLPRKYVQKHIFQMIRKQL